MGENWVGGRLAYCSFDLLLDTTGELLKYQLFSRGH